MRTRRHTWANPPARQMQRVRSGRRAARSTGVVCGTRRRLDEHAMHVVSLGPNLRERRLQIRRMSQTSRTSSRRAARSLLQRRAVRARITRNTTACRPRLPER